VSTRIDVNCDLGETEAPYRPGVDDEILGSVSSVNIACGFHAGGPAVMRGTARAAIARGVTLGAHPGLPDRENFGRKAIKISANEAYEMVLYQLGALDAIVKGEGGTLRHVKPHGALYHMLTSDKTLAGAVADAVCRFDIKLILVGFPGSALLDAGKRAGLKTAAEAFADRTYRADGTLTPRTQPNAMIATADEAAAQALRIAHEGKADTICIHGDGPNAPAFARAVRVALGGAGIKVTGL
jgi:UPF0271 protein